MDTKKPINGKHVLVVEDIIDSGKHSSYIPFVTLLGLTLKYLLGVLSKREPLSLECCVLLQKEGSAHNVAAKYVGWDCPKEAFVVGYGLDFAGTVSFLLLSLTRT
jgi:hypoxanthine phosphoribosyltransferase